MRTRQIGQGLATVVGCGDVRLATAAARGRDRSDVTRALHEALSFGIKLVEVSEEADAERLCGDAIRTLRLRDTVVLASRMNTVPPIPGRPNRDVLPERLPAGYVQERIEATLRTTKLDAIPLVQLPVRAAWRASTAWPELAGMCARLAREGKVMHYAAFLDEVEGAEEFVNEPWLVALNVEYNACNRAAAPLLDGKVPLLARHPLAGGALAGMLGPSVRLTPRDDRRAIDERTLERVAAAIATLTPLVKRESPAARSCEAAKAALERAGKRGEDIEVTNVAELALRYVCDRAIALPRLHDHQHLADAIVAASAPPLSQQLRDRIDEVLAQPKP
ncbi:MAG: aldo/keto reductase [Myxococcota bacterium]|nr:aldo/keto reductase [Myxococcota bacterium]